MRIKEVYVVLTNWEKIVSFPVCRGHLILMVYTHVLCFYATQRLQSLCLRPRHNGTRGQPDPLWSCHFSGALSWSYTQVPAHRSPFFSFSVEIFPPPSVNLKGTTSAFIYPWRTYHNNVKEFSLLQKLGNFSFFLIKKKCIYLSLAELGLHCCVRAFSSCGKRWLLFIAVHGLLIVVASLVLQHGLSSCGSWALEGRLSSCGVWA